MLTISLVLLLSTTGCQKTRDEANEIRIRTGQDAYVANSPIDVAIKNNSLKPAMHFICDNVEIAPASILKKENDTWTETEYLIFCTQMGPMGYYGTLHTGQTKHDTVSLYNEIGEFKLRYRFILGQDTLNFDSNEFLVTGLEL